METHGSSSLAAMKNFGEVSSHLKRERIINYNQQTNILSVNELIPHINQHRE